MSRRGEPRPVRGHNGHTRPVGGTRRRARRLGKRVLVPAAVAVSVTAIWTATTWTAKKVIEPIAGAKQITFVTGNGPLINIDLEQGLGCTGNGVVFPEESGISGATRPGAGPTRENKTWDTAPGLFGGVPADWADLYLTLTGPSDHAVVITGLDFHVSQKRPPLQGAFVQFADGCGAGGTFRYGEVKLDGPAPYWVDGPLPEWVTTERLAFPYTVTANDPETFYVHIRGPGCWCSWTATLGWVDGGKVGHSVIDDDGRPFQLTGASTLPRTSWSTGTGGSFVSRVDPPDPDHS